MSLKANMGSYEGITKYAQDVELRNSQKIFYCCTKGCHARMIGVNLGTKEGYFRSYDINEHISIYCIKRSIKRDVHDYSESKFNYDNMVSYITGYQPYLPHVHRNTPCKHQYHDAKVPIRTLTMMYKACLERGINGQYGGVDIKNILASQDNLAMYKNGINGFKILEVSYYRKVPYEPALLFSYPPYYTNGEHYIVKVNVPNEKEAWKYDSKFKTDRNQAANTMILAGIWRVPTDPRNLTECDLIRTRQYHYIKKLI